MNILIRRPPDEWRKDGCANLNRRGALLPEFQLPRCSTTPLHSRQNLIGYPSFLYKPHSSSMADYQRKLKRKFSGSHSRLPPSIHQSGPNATITIQGSYNDVGRDQNITNVINFGGTLWFIQSKQNLTT